VFKMFIASDCGALNSFITLAHFMSHLALQWAVADDNQILNVWQSRR
jgi:hypothetical protein